MHKIGRVAVAAIVCCEASAAAAQLPPTLVEQTFEVDPQHSTIEFVTRMLGAVKVRGRFTDYDATIVYDTAHIERSSVSAVVKVASLTTDMSFRDRHLRSPDFFDAERFPLIEFQSDSVVRSANGFSVAGQLTMHGTTRPVIVPVRVDLAPLLTPQTGQIGAAFEAQIRIDRRDFGIAGGNKYNPDYNPAFTMLADSVDIILEFSAQRTGYLDRTFAGRMPPWIADTVAKTIEARGIAAAVALYRTLRSSQPTAYNFNPGQLDGLARFLAARGRQTDALELFKLNASSFPTSSGVLQGLGDGYLMTGDRVHALASYERAFQLDSTNTTAREMKRHLSAGAK